MRDRATVSNSLLAGLPRGKSQGFDWVTLTFGDVLLQPGEPISHVFFPDNSLVSLLTEEGKRAVEVGLVGHEGMVGIPLALGVEISPVRAIVQGTGTAFRMKKKRFLKEYRKAPTLQRQLLRYSHALMAQVTQIS